MGQNASEISQFLVGCELLCWFFGLIEALAKDSNATQGRGSGRYQQAEFAADLWQVHLGEDTDEYASDQSSSAGVPRENSVLPELSVI